LHRGRLCRDGSHHRPAGAPPMTIRGRVYVLGDNIDTDQIIPAEYLNLVPTIPEEYRKLGSYALAGLARTPDQPPFVPPDGMTTELVARATIAVFPGDGIGPEVTAAAVAVLVAAAPRHGLDVTFTSGVSGGAAIDACGAPLPAAELERARGADAVLLGAVGGPKWDNPAAAARPEQALLVDAVAMDLIRRPRDFDVIATETLFGDILTDEAAMLAGSMGMLPSASLAGPPVPGARCRGLYEPIHGSAPDIAGQDRANPL